MMLFSRMWITRSSFSGIYIIHPIILYFVLLNASSLVGDWHRNCVDGTCVYFKSGTNISPSWKKVHWSRGVISVFQGVTTFPMNILVIYSRIISTYPAKFSNGLFLLIYTKILILFTHANLKFVGLHKYVYFSKVTTLESVLMSYSNIDDCVT